MRHPRLDEKCFFCFCTERKEHREYALIHAEVGDDEKRVAGYHRHIGERSEKRHRQLCTDKDAPRGFIIPRKTATSLSGGAQGVYGNARRAPWSRSRYK